jgi:dihydrofolate reductase
MYAGYQHYWRSILAAPGAILEFSGKPATQGEIQYAHFADKTAHYVLSKTLADADWENTQIVRDVEEIRRLKMLPGKDMHAVGGAGLIDELRLIVHPLVLGKGMPLFKDVKERQALTLLDVTPLQSGLLRLKYST